MTTYESKLAADLQAALRQGSMHFDEKSAVFHSLRKVTLRLSELNVPYAVAGGTALFSHGFRRFTEDVDLLVTSDGLRQIHAALDGLGYVPPFAGSKQLRDAETGVRIEFLITGQYPGDGKPKPVAFPDPAEASEEIDHIRFLRLAPLIELKLASGMTGGVTRLKDLADVVALIQIRQLNKEFADGLNPYVRDKYLELWQGIQDSPAAEH
jgi:hypothetical protein